MPAEDVIVIFCTCPPADASRIARALVTRRLCACVNIVGGVVSVYRWQDKLEEEGESLLVIKGTESGFEDLRQALVELHPYDVPEVVCLDVKDGHGPYLDWVRSCVGPEPE